MDTGTSVISTAGSMTDLIDDRIGNENLFGDKDPICGGATPQLNAVGLGWVNFQVMRRTHSSLLKELDVDPHVRAEQMGHTVNVNENVYTRTSFQRRRDAVNKLEAVLIVH